MEREYFRILNQAMAKHIDDEILKMTHFIEVSVSGRSAKVPVSKEVFDGWQQIPESDKDAQLEYLSKTKGLMDTVNGLVMVSGNTNQSNDAVSYSFEFTKPEI